MSSALSAFLEVNSENVLDSEGALYGLKPSVLTKSENIQQAISEVLTDGLKVPLFSSLDNDELERRAAELLLYAAKYGVKKDLQGNVHIATVEDTKISAPSDSSLFLHIVKNKGLDGEKHGLVCLASNYIGTITKSQGGK